MAPSPSDLMKPNYDAGHRPVRRELIPPDRVHRLHSMPLLIHQSSNRSVGGRSGASASPRAFSILVALAVLQRRSRDQETPAGQRVHLMRMIEHSAGRYSRAPPGTPRRCRASSIKIASSPRLSDAVVDRGSRHEPLIHLRPPGMGCKG